MTRARKGTVILIKILLAILAVYLLYLCITIKVQINAKSAEKADLDAQVSVETAKNQELTDTFNAPFDEEYAEQVARDVGYVNSDEKVYEITTD